MKTTGTTATNNERRTLTPACGTAAFASPLTLGVPNKSVLPTATNQFGDDSLGALRRQTGEPLDSREERRAMPFEKQNAGNGQWATALSSMRRDDKQDDDGNARHTRTASGVGHA